MQLPNPKELKALLKVCRDFGVETVEVGELKVKFGDLPQEAEAGGELGNASSVSDEDLAYWSSQPDPLASVRDSQ